jgi:hypothetical protein
MACYEARPRSLFTAEIGGFTPPPSFTSVDDLNLPRAGVKPLNANQNWRNSMAQSQPTSARDAVRDIVPDLAGGDDRGARRQGCVCEGVTVTPPSPTGRAD